MGIIPLRGSIVREAPERDIPNCMEIRPEAFKGTAPGYPGALIDGSLIFLVLPQAYLPTSFILSHVRTSSPGFKP